MAAVAVAAAVAAVVAVVVEAVVVVVATVRIDLSQSMLHHHHHHHMRRRKRYTRKLCNLYNTVKQMNCQDIITSAISPIPTWVCG